MQIEFQTLSGLAVNVELAKEVTVYEATKKVCKAVKDTLNKDFNPDSTVLIIGAQVNTPLQEKGDQLFFTVFSRVLTDAPIRVFQKLDTSVSEGEKK